MLKIPISIPKELGSSQAVRRKREWKDTPDAINKLRNDLIHPKASLAFSRSKVVPEVWRLAQWYIELFIFALCGYDGKYSRRTRRGMWIGDVELVPWVKRKKIGKKGNEFVFYDNIIFIGLLFKSLIFRNRYFNLSYLYCIMKT